jgi:prepilin-type N-terminal cleavage/methylation domain-containing protein
MVPRRPLDDRGLTMVELLVAVAIGGVVLMGMFSLYRAAAYAFVEASSQAALQRQGTLALEAITSQGWRASTITFNTCAPAGTTSRSLQLTVNDTTPASLPAAQLGTYCYYAGNGANGAPAGALCQQFTPVGGVADSCWNLLDGPQTELIRRTGQAGVWLVPQTNPATPVCPRNPTDAAGNPVAGGQAIANGVHCVALGQSTGAGAQDTGDVAFAITDGVNSMTFSASLMRRN